MGEAVREAYSDLFVLKAKPTSADRQMIAGKYKATYNLSDVSADRASRTFLALLELSDPDTVYGSAAPAVPKADVAEKAIARPDASLTPPVVEPQKKPASPPVGLHYSIQIHLPATKDVEVYNAIFKSLRSHLIE